jgi:DNA polymerase IV
MALDFPTIFLLPAQLGSEELEQLDEQIPTLTYDINEAEVVLGKVSRKERALFELRKHKLVTEEIDTTRRSESASPELKRLRLMTPVLASSDLDSDTASEGEIQRRLVGPAAPGTAGQTVKVVKLSWFTDSIKAGLVLPLDDYLVYEGRKVLAAPETSQPPPPAEKAAEVLKRALADASALPPSSRQKPFSGRRGETYARNPVRPTLVRQTTSEHEVDAHLPPIPDYLHTTYSCQRPTPVHPPNEPFIEELSKIKTARTLTGDKIGVRAYSSAIATIAAYPYTFQTSQGREEI